jgi:hypothetical protein
MAFLMPSSDSIKAQETAYHPTGFLNVFRSFYWFPFLHIPQGQKIRLIVTGYLSAVFIVSPISFPYLIGKLEDVPGRLPSALNAPLLSL